MGGISSLDKDKQQATLQLRESKSVRFRKQRNYSHVKVRIKQGEKRSEKEGAASCDDASGSGYKGVA